MRKKICVRVHISRWRIVVATTLISLYRLACRLTFHQPTHPEVRSIERSLTTFLANGTRIHRG